MIIAYTQPLLSQHTTPVSPYLLCTIRHIRLTAAKASRLAEIVVCVRSTSFCVVANKYPPPSPFPANTHTHTSISYSCLSDRSTSLGRAGAVASPVLRKQKTAASATAVTHAHLRAHGRIRRPPVQLSTTTVAIESLRPFRRICWRPVRLS